jgi:hypothetical protein
MSVRKNKSARLERNQAISSGLRRLPSKTMIPINGKLVAAGDAAAVFEAGTEAEKEVSAARAKYLQMAAAARAFEATITDMIPPIKSFVQNSFGERSQSATSFGFKPHKTRYVSAEVRYESVEKARATRAARGAPSMTSAASN